VEGHVEAFEARDLPALIRDVVQGALGMHERGIARCDIRSRNVVKRFEEVEGCRMQIIDAETSMRCGDNGIEGLEEAARDRLESCLRALRGAVRGRRKGAAPGHQEVRAS
jgi:hypothetical protein